MVKKQINNTLTSTKGFEDLYPFDSNFININGHDLHYIDKGKGKPVLMVHGNPTWSFYYRHLIKTLSKNFRTIAPDHIGCGFSDKPGSKTYDYTLESRVKDLDALVNQLNINEKISLVVHDWGGMIGLAWAIDHPDKIDKIVITNTSGFFLPKEKQFPFLLWLIKYIRAFAVPAVLGLNAFAKGALYLGSETRLSEKVKKGLVEPYNSWKNRIATLKFVQDIPITQKDKSYAIVNHVDQNLKHLDESSLMFLWGAKDFVFDLTFFNEFKTRFPKAASHVFHDAGHYLFEDKPEETSHLIKAFLNQ
ncbi:alpha/beta fold hydrolase [Desulfobacula toluolica]|uniref:DhmA: predicted haloalkane dehalogenase n=1 Tax=Desulfobacula toluolica (strain DSM 7467 / Tol2) TaxID=651182 RepID=K0NL34_DESTT|nr:alpha/beta fold hydrolase [Desulfobacula toluolica]CCK80653.1 DhmA: predicted haloalkane dehalogenase [Desulfobacula toluolica Tol2]